MLLLTRMAHPTVYTSLLVCRQMKLENKTCDQDLCVWLNYSHTEQDVRKTPEISVLNSPGLYFFCFAVNMQIPWNKI